MSTQAFINVLIAEDNEVSREMMSGILRAQGYNILGAVDGESAIKVVEEHDVDIALVDINMAPKGGFEFVKYLVAKGIKTPVVIITGDDSGDILVEATSLGVSRVLQKPVSPDRLTQTVERILRRRGFNPAPLAVEAHETSFSPEALMQRVINMAAENAAANKGGPYAALVTNKQGKILGEGRSGKSARVDPTAHAEVMAMRQAAEKIGKADLSECILYCSSEPTRVGHAVIISTGIEQVFYGLSQKDMGEVSTITETSEPIYEQMGRDAALEMFRTAKQNA